MLTSAPKCRVVCNGKPGEVMDELVAAFRALRAEGIPEDQALLVSRDPEKIARLFPSGSIGGMRATAEAFVSSGCAECAVNLAYAPKAP